MMGWDRIWFGVVGGRKKGSSMEREGEKYGKRAASRSMWTCVWGGYGWRWARKVIWVYILGSGTGSGTDDMFWVVWRWCCGCVDGAVVRC